MGAVPGQPDLELGHIRDGYPALAAWIGKDPDNETFVFRKFDRLSARNLLHLQCQLIQLEDEIDELDDEAREKARLDKADELAVKIKEYHETLLRQAQIAELSRPSNRVLSAFRDYLEGNGGKGPGLQSIPIISGRAKEMLKEADALVALGKPADEDLLSQFLRDHWVFQKRNTTDPLDRTTFYKGQHVTWTVAAISMICAAVLLVVAIVTLYIVNNPTAKLAMVAAYTVLFALSIALLTNSRRAEIYGTAAAYAAVLVVFISGDLGSSQPEQCMVQLSNGYFKVVNCPS
ncbi:hypothetical protein DL765_002328 [Monosporascus sp. GIB2]|nr:hypothetical protein DL765_002328 [Monosporascus sp. GIB2]